MSATAQCVKSRSDAALWTVLFSEAEASNKSSGLFMKKLLALGISNILFWRGLLPEAAFGERQVGESRLKVLRNEKECPAAHKIISWIKACFEPITKSWLRNAYLVIRDSNNVTTLETYTFRFQYNQDEVTTEIYRNSKKISSVEGSTLQMLTNISAVVKPLGAPPLPCMISLDVDFNRPTPNTDIPKEVSIPGFVSVDELDHIFEERRIAINLGDISTAYHECKLQIRTTESRLNIDRGKESGGADGAAKQSIAEKQDSQSSIKQPALKRHSKQDASLDTDSSSPDGEPKAKQTKCNSSVGEHSSDRSAASNDNLEVTCPCKSTKNSLTTIACHRCKELQHLICYGFPPYLGDCSDVDEQLVDDFICFNCSPYLQEMHKFSSTKFRELCLVRQVVADIVSNGSDAMQNPILSDHNAVKARLMKEKIISMNKQSKRLSLVKRSVDKADQLYFDSLKTYSSWDKPMQPEPSKKKNMRQKSGKTSK